MNYDSDYEIRLATLEAMGGDVTKEYDSVYDIDLEILRLIEEGGGSGKPIEEVSELPEASENKDKFYRVDGEDGIYAAKLLSSETITTNKLPDEQQIDKAYLYLQDDEPFYYKGTYKIICTDGEIDGYVWLETYPDSDDWYFTLTKDNAVNVSVNSLGCYSGSDDILSIDEVNKVITSEYHSVDYFTFNEINTYDGATPVPAIYNAPESAQIGNAEIKESTDFVTGRYLGTTITFIDSDDNIEVTGYEWDDLEDTQNRYVTSKPASDIYFSNNDNNLYTDVTIWYINLRTTPATGRKINIDKFYIPQLNAPDSEQVDNAYISEDYMGGNAVYTGEETTIEVDGNTLTVYKWANYDEPTYPIYVYSTKPAYQIYNIDKDSDDVHFYIEDGENIEEITFANEFLLAISTVKYQRTETTEEWGWEKIATEQYVDNAIAEIPQLEAGENIEIADNKISAIGYKAGNSMTSSFAELPEIITEPYMDMASQLPSTDLYFTGEAGSTQYTVSGQLVTMIGSMVGMVAFQVGSGNIAKLLALDSTNNIVTLDKSLDDNNALSAAQMSKLYMVIDVQISGDADATTYTYTDTSGAFHPLTNVDTKIKIGDYALRTVTNITNNTITFDETLDAENAVSNVKWMYTVNVNNNASGINSHAEGRTTTASGAASHSEGVNTEASGVESHAEGDGTTASGGGSHAEGYDTTASGLYSHAEGDNTVSEGTGSHAEGVGTRTQNLAEHAEGNNNLSHKANGTWGNAGNTLHSIGMAAGYTHTQKNAFEIMQNGDMYVYGIGGYVGTDTTVQDSTIQTLQAYIASLEARIAALENPNA